MGQCCGSYVQAPAADEQHELVQNDSAADAVRAQLSSWKDRLLTAAGRPPPDPEYDAAARLLAEGCVFRTGAGGSGADMVQVKTSADGTMLTWHSMELVNNMPKASGALPLSKLTKVERAQGLSMGSLLGGARAHTLALHHGSSGEQLRLDAADARTADTWADALRKVSAKQAADQEGASTQRSLTRHAAKELELRARRQEAERRKADILGTMGGGGMKHTAVAMMQRKD